MQFFEVLQVIIAIIFIYLILSLLASELQEAIATFIQFRSRNLRKSIAILLGEPQTESLTNLIYETAKIKSLNQYTNSDVLWTKKKLWKVLGGNSVGPSFMNKETFTDALLEVLQGQLKDNDKLKSNTQIIINDNSTNKDHLIGKLESIIIEKKNPDLENSIRRLINIAESVALKKDSDPKLQDFRAELEKLFEQAQEHTSGVYKRNAKGMSFIIGSFLSFGLNVDFFYMANALSKNPKWAEDISNVATTFYDNKSEALTKFNQLEECKKNNPNSLENCNQTEREFNETLRKALEENDTNIEDIIFWSGDFNRTDKLPKDKWDNNIQIMGWLKIPIKLIGFIVSAIAIAMGAPFWFDLLGKFINVRNTLKPISPKKK